MRWVKRNRSPPLRSLCRVLCGCGRRLAGVVLPEASTSRLGPNKGWEKDRVPTCTSRISEGRSGAQGSGERIATRTSGFFSLAPVLLWCTCVSASARQSRAQEKNFTTKLSHTTPGTALAKERKQRTQGRDGRTARRHHTGILRRGVWC